MKKLAVLFAAALACVAAVVTPQVSAFWTPTCTGHVIYESKWLGTDYAIPGGRRVTVKKDLRFGCNDDATSGCVFCDHWNHWWWGGSNHAPYPIGPYAVEVLDCGKDGTTKTLSKVHSIEPDCTLVFFSLDILKLQDSTDVCTGHFVGGPALIYGSVVGHETGGCPP